MDDIDLDKEIMFDFSKQTAGTAASEFIFIVLINVLAFSLFILFFFFVMTAKVEQNVVKTSVTDLVAEFAAEMKMVLPLEQQRDVAKILKTVTLPNMEAADKEVRDQNNKLLHQAVVVLCSSAAGVALIVTLWFFIMRAVARKGAPSAARGIQYPDMRKVALVTTFSFVAVALTEFVFLGTVAAQYKPLDANKVRVAILKALIEKGGK